MKRSLQILPAIALTAMVVPAWSATLYVDATNTSGIEDGTLQYPYNTVVEAVETAVEYDTISVAPGIYYGRINVPLSMNIVSQQGPEVTVLDGAGDYVGIFYKDINYGRGPTVHSLEGFTLTNSNTLMYAWRTAYIHVRNCIFKDATIGLQAGMAAGVKVYNSVFTNLSGQAVYTFWNTGPYLYNVTIDNVTTAAFVGTTPFRMYNSTVSNVATVFDFLNNPAFIGDSVNIWNYTTYFGRSYDTSRFTMDNEMSVDPMFVAPPGDYRLMSGSQLIDAGFDVGLPFVGVAPDIGAYEFEELTLPQQVEVLAESFADMPAETLLGPAEKRQNALDNKLVAVLKMVTDAASTDNDADKARALNGALGKLTGDILQKTDGNNGGNPANDWIADSELKTEIYEYVMSLIEAIEAELAAFN